MKIGLKKLLLVWVVVMATGSPSVASEPFSGLGMGASVCSEAMTMVSNALTARVLLEWTAGALTAMNGVRIANTESYQDLSPINQTWFNQFVEARCVEDPSRPYLDLVGDIFIALPTVSISSQ